MRLEADNPGFALKPGMFVDVELPIELPPTLAVPADAIVDSGLRKTVFVDRGDGYFEPRPVETGWRVGDQVEVVRGLMAGERIVLSGTFLIDSESRMRRRPQGLGPRRPSDPVCGMRGRDGTARHGEADDGRSTRERPTTSAPTSCRQSLRADPRAVPEARGARRRARP